MTNTIFYSNGFKINGKLIPGFELQKGRLIRIYIPNFDGDNKFLGRDLMFELIKHFQNKIPKSPWAKDYSQPRLWEFLSPLTVEGYLTGKMKIGKNRARELSQELQISLDHKLDHLSFATRKALIIKAYFVNHDFIIFDYYGVGAMWIRFLEDVVNGEIENGKSAIAFDNLEYTYENEPYGNIIPIKIAITEPW